MTNYLIMTQKELKLKSIMDKLISQSIFEHEAARLAHKSLRQIQRIKKRYREHGDVGLIHKARLRKSNHQYDTTKYNEAVSIIQKYYHDYSYVMMQEKLQEKHSFIITMLTLHNELIRRGIRVVKKQKKPDTQRKQYIKYSGCEYLPQNLSSEIQQEIPRRTTRRVRSPYTSPRGRERAI